MCPSIAMAPVGSQTKSSKVSRNPRVPLSSPLSQETLAEIPHYFLLFPPPSPSQLSSLFTFTAVPRETNFFSFPVSVQCVPQLAGLKDLWGVFWVSPVGYGTCCTWYILGQNRGMLQQSSHCLAKSIETWAVLYDSIECRMSSCRDYCTIEDRMIDDVLSLITGEI